MKRVFTLSILFSTLFLISCTSTYKINTNFPENIFLEKNKNIGIAVCEDGSYGSDTYGNSGRTVANIIKENLKPFANKITIYRRNEFLEDFSEEELKENDYIIIPEILHWEDRATAWSGLPDKVTINLEIYSSNKSYLGSTTIDGKSASMTLGTTDPSELIQEPLKEFLNSIFKK